MKKLIAFTATAATLCTASYAASIESMNKDQVMQTFEDKTLSTVSLSTINNKLVQDSVAIYLGKDGKVVGKLAKKMKNLPQKDSGTWTVSDEGQLCITWQKWFDNKPFCDYVYNANNSVIFVNAGGELVSIALRSHIQSGNLVK